VRLVQVLYNVPLPVLGAGQPFTLPPNVLRELEIMPVAALILGFCWLVSLIWYFALIISTSFGIQQGVHVKRVEYELSIGRLSR
jgi:hypothetical protein